MNHIMEMALKLGFDCDRAELIREKDGVAVARLYGGGRTAILKHFSDIPSRREISNYALLAELGVPVLKIYASNTETLIIEDMDSTECPYRLATEADMADENIAARLAGWYRRLHDSGFAYVKDHGASMYSEADLFTRQNIAKVRKNTGFSQLPVWRLLDDNFDRIARIIAAAPMTLTYNDFYYTNMAVARDSSSAIMFDYNLLGRGHAYSDMRNVTYSLSESAARAFMEAYGPYDISLEAAIDAVVSPIVTLHFAYERAVFPDWAVPELENLQNGYITAVEALLERE